jgi:hypothetical protein
LSFGEQTAEGPAVAHERDGGVSPGDARGRPVALLGQTYQGLQDVRGAGAAGRGGGRRGHADQQGRVALCGGAAGADAAWRGDLDVRRWGAVQRRTPERQARGARGADQSGRAADRGGVEGQPDGRPGASVRRRRDADVGPGMGEGHPGRQWLGAAAGSQGALRRALVEPAAGWGGGVDPGGWHAAGRDLEAGVPVGAKPPVAAFTDVVHCGPR